MGKPSEAHARELAQAFGAHLRALRLHAGLTQADLAGQSLSRAGVAKLESGASLPSIATLAVLASALRVRLRALMPRGY
jgi:transcriptional regulator with XRE-family HTH domain